MRENSERRTADSERMRACAGKTPGKKINIGTYLTRFLAPKSSVKYSRNALYANMFATPERLEERDDSVPLRPQDYFDGNISSDGEDLIKEIQERSQHSRRIGPGKPFATKYYGVECRFRVDKTPHGSFARSVIDGLNLSTQRAADYCRALTERPKSEQNAFLKGFQGSVQRYCEVQANEKDAYEFGVQLRGLVRVSDCLANGNPLVDGYQMARVRSVEDVANLFANPALNTGGLVSQNYSSAKQGEYAFAKNVLASGGSSHSTRPGTPAPSTAHYRKSRAINASFPGNRPLIDIEEQNG